MLTPIGIVEKGDKSCWWIMPDGENISGCPEYLLKEIQSVYLKQKTFHLLKACKYTIEYCFWTLINNGVKSVHSLLTSFQRFVGWPR